MIKKTLVFSNKAYLSLKLKQLVIKRENGLTGEEEVITRPIEDIGIMMIESGQVTLTSSLVSELIQNNIGVIFCDSKHMPANMILPLEAIREINCSDSGIPSIEEAIVATDSIS